LNRSSNGYRVMQKWKAILCNAKVAGATLLCRSSRRYTVMQNLQLLYCNAELAVATL
jgi:hypothetical protein